MTSLDLAYNNIYDMGAQHLSEVLKTNTTLTSLDLAYNNIYDMGAQHLSEVLKTNTTLTSLDLTCNNIRAEGARCLSEVLKTNTTLTSLILAYNTDIGDEEARRLSEVLKTNTTLTSLNLNCNNIGNAGAQHLSEALKSNTTLTSLNLTCNNIDNAGAQYLSEALKSNTTLTSLNLADNKIGADGVQYLSEVLKTNTTLTSLDFSGNNIGAEQKKRIRQQLDTNQFLDVHSNNTALNGVLSSGDILPGEVLSLIERALIIIQQKSDNPLPLQNVINTLYEIQLSLRNLFSFTPARASSSQSAQASFASSAIFGNSLQSNRIPKPLSANETSQSYASIFKSNKPLASIKNLLTQNPSALNELDSNGQTLLHYAVIYRNIPVLKLLIKKGVQRGLQNKDQKIALQLLPDQNSSDYNLIAAQIAKLLKARPLKNTQPQKN